MVSTCLRANSSVSRSVCTISFSRSVSSNGNYTYLYGNDRIAQQSTGGTGYFLTDALGSVRQLVDEEGEITLNRSYDPYGNVLASSGDGESAFAFTGEQMDSYSGLLYLRTRYMSSEIGRFLSRDLWQGNLSAPLSLNKWMYVSGNPINRIDPLGLWALAPGLNLREGGIFGKGVLEVQPCEGRCYGPPQSISIFVPSVFNGKLYNDQYYLRYGYTDIHLIKRWTEYDILHKLGMPDCSGEKIIAKNTDDWKVVYQKSGKSYSFSKGALIDLASAVAMANGYDQGFIPININFSSPYDQSMSIALAIMASSKFVDKEVDLKVFNDAMVDRDVFNARLGMVIGITQGVSGAREMNGRQYTVTIQEHKNAPGLFRAIIESYIAFKSAALDNSPIFLGANFISFSRGSWVENRYMTTILR
jgi:RHS repeat-associated protein